MYYLALSEKLFKTSTRWISETSTMLLSALFLCAISALASARAPNHGRGLRFARQTENDGLQNMVCALILLISPPNSQCR
jgi:hypothetical protein